MLPVERFIGFAEQHNLFTRDTKILAAVSGGMDSVLMAQLLKQAGYQFAIAHCNFMLRGDEADADQQFTRDLAQTMGVQFHTVQFDTRQYAADKQFSIQMAARELRYNWFTQLCETVNYGAVALAHHQNDTIETILLNLTRGTGIAGMHGILPKKGLLVRPLMFLTRDEITQLVRDHKIAYREDSSNSSTKYARNKIRHEVVPVLKELNPSLEGTFEKNLRHFRELEVLLNDKVESLQSKMLNYNGTEVSISIKAIRELKPQHLLLYRLLQPFGFSEMVTDDLIGVLEKHPGRKFESTTHDLITDRERVIIIQKTAADNAAVMITQSTHFVYFGKFKLTLLHDDSAVVIKDNPLAVSIDAEKLTYPLTLRSWEQGDFFYPLGMQTRQKLSDFFIHQKVPLHQKAAVPILVNANGDVVWIGGYRPDNRYRVDNNTKKVTIFELVKL